ncbi:MAG: hypothetical protein JWP80_4586 [Pseudomonas sp.]|nr:hypothetical protein [Pseudomonas sp.]
MKSSVYLLLSAMAVSTFAWVFWHYLGNQASSVLGALIMLALTVDNIRLRRQLKKRAVNELRGD